MADLKEALRSIPFLATLTDTLLDQIAAFSALRTVRAGETIFCQGEPSPYCFGVVRGQVSIQRVPHDRHRPPKILSILGPGALFGESALFEDTPRAAMASAVQESQLVAVLGAKWREWIKKDAQASAPLLIALLQNTLSRVQQTSTDLAVVYGVGKILTGPGAFFDRLSSTLSFVQSSLSEVDHVAFYERSLSRNAYQAVAGAPEPARWPTVPLASAFAQKLIGRQARVLATGELEVPWPAAAKAVIPLTDFSAPEAPPEAFVLAVSEESAKAYGPSRLVLLSALGSQWAEAFLRNRHSAERSSKTKS